MATALSIRKSTSLQAIDGSASIEQARQVVEKSGAEWLAVSRNGMFAGIVEAQSLGQPGACGGRRIEDVSERGGVSIRWL